MFGCIEAKNVEAKDATNPFFNFISANILFPLSMARWLNCDTFLNGCDCRNQIQKYLTNCHKITQKRPAWKVLGFRTFPEVKMRKERAQENVSSKENPHIYNFFHSQKYVSFLDLDVQTTLSEEDVSSSSNVHRKLDFSFSFFLDHFQVEMESSLSLMGSHLEQQIHSSVYWKSFSQ